MNQSMYASASNILNMYFYYDSNMHMLQENHMSVQGEPNQVMHMLYAICHVLSTICHILTHKDLHQIPKQILINSHWVSNKSM